MAIGQIEMQGQILRTQDYTAVKHREDNHSADTQSQIQTQQQKEGVRHVQRVNQKDRAEQGTQSFDAKEKGSNEYRGDGGRHRRDKEKAAEGIETEQAEVPDGKVLIKGVTHS